MSRPSRRKYGWGIMRRRIARSPLFARTAPPVLEIPNGPLRHVEEIDRELHGKVGSPPGGLREAASPEQVPEHVPEIEWFPPAIRPGVEIRSPGPPVRAIGR